MGCFWGPQRKYQQVKGVEEVVVGYTGGTNTNPTYNSVCKNDGHSESVFITYDDEVVTFQDLITIYFDYMKNQPIITEGQYASKIFTNNDDERKIIEKIKSERRINGYPVIENFNKFYIAELYHQDFERKNAWRTVLLGVGVICSIVPNLDPLYYRCGSIITITYIIITLVERFTNTEVKELSMLK